MLTKHAKAYSSSCSQLILIYLYAHRRNSLFAAENRKKITKTSYFWIQCHSRSSMLIQVKSTPLCLLW